MMRTTHVPHPRRIITAIAISLTTHGALVVACVAPMLWSGLPTLPVQIDVATVAVDELRELPLGLPALDVPGNPPDELPVPELAKPEPSPKLVRPAIKPKVKRPEATPGVESAHAVPLVKPTSVRSYAPAGSRVVALVRLDRLRGTHYADPVDGVLKLLPDRRDLLEGTDLDLYRDVDALMAATPNPLDAFATLLVVRHRLADAALRTALEKGARATGRKLIWHSERGRPFAERVAATPTDAPGGAPPARRRDERLILLAAPRLAVVTPPSYRKLLLGAHPPAAITAPAEPTPDPSADENGWASLVNRIDAADGILPENAVAMLSVAGLFAAPTSPALVMGLPAPRLLTAVLGIVPQPFLNADAEFDTPAAAERWQQEWPQMRHQLLTNAIVVLTGLGHIIAGVTVERTESTIHVHLEATEDETIHILSFLAIQLPLLRR